MAKVLCAAGIHVRVFEGGGMMDDALTCVDCGRHKYPEAFGLALVKKPRPFDEDGMYYTPLTPADWEKV